MNKKSGKSGRASSMPQGLIFGGATNVSITVAGCMILAKLLESEKMAWDKVGYGIMITLLLGSFAGAWVACRQIKRKIMQVGIISGVIYWGILLCITMLCFGGKTDGAVVSGALIMAGSICAALAGPCAKRGGKRAKKELAIVNLYKNQGR